MSYSQWIRTTTRNRIYTRDKFLCLWCQRDLIDAAPHERSLDHILPRSKGGSHKPSNLVTACRSCNDDRSDMSAIKFAYLQAGHRGDQKPGLRVSRRACRTLNRILEAVCTEI